MLPSLGSRTVDDVVQSSTGSSDAWTNPADDDACLMQAQEVPGPEGPLMAQGGEIAFVPFARLKLKVISTEVNANMTAIVVLSMALEQRQPGRLRLRVKATHGHPAVNHITRAWRWWVYQSASGRGCTANSGTM